MDNKVHGCTLSDEGIKSSNINVGFLFTVPCEKYIKSAGLVDLEELKFTKHTADQTKKFICRCSEDRKRQSQRI